MKYSEYLARRKNTFEKAYELLRKINQPYRIIELGTSRSYVSGGFPGCMNPDPTFWDENTPSKWDWGAGIFTKVFSDTLDEDACNYILYTVDPDENANKVVTTMCGTNKNISILQDYSTNILNSVNSKIDFLYMDHMENGEAATLKHLEDSKILVERDLINENGIILVDYVGDSTTNSKGKYSVPYLVENGFEIVIHEYQVLLKKVSKQLVPRIIYFTWMKEAPEIVFKRWKQLNPLYITDFSDDTQCILFLKENFGDEMAEFFVNIPIGMYKADLWRLCKLYIHGGVYSDIDVVPYINIDTILAKGYTFCTCLSIEPSYMFQAFFITKPRNPLLYACIQSFVQTVPMTQLNGPSADMYECIKYSLDVDTILPDTEYTTNTIRMKVYIGSSTTSSKTILLVDHFPRNSYTIHLNQTEFCFPDVFEFSISNNILTIVRKDADVGWGYPHSVTVTFQANEKYIFFPEIRGEGNDWVTSCVAWNKTKIIDSRDIDYHLNKW
jgi:hypothetical protein